MVNLEQPKTQSEIIESKKEELRKLFNSLSSDNRGKEQQTFDNLLNSTANNFWEKVIFIKSLKALISKFKDIKTWWSNTQVKHQLYSAVMGKLLQSNNGFITDARKHLSNIDINQVSDDKILSEIDSTLEWIKVLDLQKDQIFILSSVVKIKNVYSEYIENKTRQEKKTREKLEKETTERLLWEIGKIEINWNIEEEASNKLTKKIEQLISIWGLTKERIEFLQSILLQLKWKKESEIPDFDDEFDQITRIIKKTEFPAKIDILWKEVEFENKTQALQVLMSVKEFVKAEIETYKDIVEELSFDILNMLILMPVWALVDVNMFLWEFFITSQLPDSVDHISNKEFFSVLFVDLIPALIWSAVILNLDVVIATAILETLWRFAKDISWSSFGMWLMEDYARRWRINIMSAETATDQEVLEYYQRESILEWLRSEVEKSTNTKMKEKLLKNLKNLEKYKLVNTDTFYFKAYLIWKRIWLKSIINPKYLLVRWMSIVNGAKFVYPNVKSWKIWQVRKKFILTLTKDWVSFEKQKFTPELNRIIEKWMQEWKRWAEEVFKKVDVTWNTEKRKPEANVVDNSDGPGITKARNYIKWLKISSKEKERRNKMLDRYKTYLKQTPLISVNNVKQELYKVIELWFIDDAEFKSIIKDKFKEILDDSITLEDMLEWKSEKKLNRFLWPKKRLLFKLIKLFNNWEWEWTKEELNNLIEDIKHWRIKLLKPKTVDIQDLDSPFEKWEKLEKQFKEWKKIILWEWGNKIADNLSNIIDINLDLFDFFNEELFEEIFSELKVRIESWEINLTENQAKSEIVKMYNRYLPDFVVVDIIKGSNDYWSKLDWLRNKGDNVKDFLSKVESWNWYWTIDELREVITSLDRGGYIDAKKVTFDDFIDINDGIKDINDIWPIMHQRSFRRTNYWIPFDSRWKLEIKDFRINEVELSKLFHSLAWTVFDDGELNELFSLINDRWIDFSSRDFFLQMKGRLLSNEIEINVNDSMTRDSFNNKIALLNIWKLDKLLKWFDSKTIKEQERIIIDIKNKLWISSQNYSSDKVLAMDKAGYPIWYIIDTVSVFDQRIIELKKNEIIKKEKIESTIKSIDEDMNFLKDYKISHTREWYIKASVALLEKGIELEQVDNLLSINESGPSYYSAIEKAIEKRIIELGTEENKLKEKLWIRLKDAPEILDFKYEDFLERYEIECTILWTEPEFNIQDKLLSLLDWKLTEEKFFLEMKEKNIWIRSYKELSAYIKVNHPSKYTKVQSIINTRWLKSEKEKLSIFKLIFKAM